MMTAQDVKSLALDCGFDLAGVTPALPLAEAAFYQQWVKDGFAGEMRYLTDHRAEVRNDPRRLLPAVKSILCVGKLYGGEPPESPEMTAISRYAWGRDYHDVLREGLGRVAARIREAANEPVEYKICVDTAPLLERAYARYAGLGWIGKNSCLISQEKGSWFFLGELLLSLDLDPDAPPPDRCGTCTRCIDACPTAAIVPGGEPGPAWTIDSRRCISYFTIELRGPIPAEARAGVGGNVFGCDICQDVCPWNRPKDIGQGRDFKGLGRDRVRFEIPPDPVHVVQRVHSYAQCDAGGMAGSDQVEGPAPPLEKLAALSEQEFRAVFRSSAVKRARYTGFLRNLAVAMGNLRLEKFREPLARLAQSPDPMVAEHARWGLERLG